MILSFPYQQYSGEKLQLHSKSFLLHSKLHSVAFLPVSLGQNSLYSVLVSKNAYSPDHSEKSGFRGIYCVVPGAGLEPAPPFTGDRILSMICLLKLIFSLSGKVCITL